MSGESLLAHNTKANAKRGYSSIPLPHEVTNYDSYEGEHQELDDDYNVEAYPKKVSSTTSLPSPTGEFMFKKGYQGSGPDRAYSFSGSGVSTHYNNGEELYGGRKSISIPNPIGIDRRLSTVLNLDELYKRVDLLNDMRPARLIGSASKLRDWTIYYLNETQLSNLKNKKLRAFYEQQNLIIDRYCDVDKLLDSGIHMSMIATYGDNPNEDLLSTTNRTNHPPANVDLEGGKALGYDSESSDAIVQFAIWVTFGINILLLLGKVFVALSTKSMSIVASLVDSVLDFLSTLIIFYANKKAGLKSSEFPIGRKRLEPLGVLVFSVIITVSFLNVLQESVNQLLWGEREIVHLTKTSFTIMTLTIVVKIFCFIWCKNIKNSSVQALAEDAETDIVFNFFSIIFPIVGILFTQWWVDSAGAILLCLYVIMQWGSIAFEHINNLTGASASKEDYHEILYLIIRFSDKISKIKNFRTYHVGDLINVEVDVVFQDPSMQMKDCHDLGESLQYAIETLPFVERCFVHLDYKVINFSGHIG